MYAKFAATSLLAASAAAATASDLFSGDGAKITGDATKSIVGATTKYTYRFDQNGNNADTNYQGSYELEKQDNKFSETDGPYSMLSCVESYVPTTTSSDKYSCTLQTLEYGEQESIVKFSTYKTDKIFTTASALEKQTPQCLFNTTVPKGSSATRKDVLGDCKGV